MSYLFLFPAFTRTLFFAKSYASNSDFLQEVFRNCPQELLSSPSPLYVLCILSACKLMDYCGSIHNKYVDLYMWFAEILYVRLCLHWGCEYLQSWHRIISVYTLPIPSQCLVLHSERACEILSLTDFKTWDRFSFNCRGKLALEPSFW